MWWGSVFFCVHKARHEEAQGARPTQWDREWEPRRTDATVQRNTNDICCTWKRGIILPLGIPRRDFRRPLFPPPLRRATEERGKGSCGGGGGTETDFFFFFPAPRPRPASKNPPFVFVPRLRRFSWESLTDSSLYAALLCDSYHTGPESSARRLLISLLFRGMKIHPPPPPPPMHTDTSL